MRTNITNVGINGRYTLRARPTGVQRAADTLVRALTADDPERFQTLAPRGNASRVGAQVWEQCVASVAARHAGCRVLLNPMQTSPVFHAGLKQIVVVHDLHFLHHPEWFGWGFNLWNQLVTVQALRRADHVVAVSDYVLKDVRRSCKIPPERSSRIYNIGPVAAGHAAPELRRPATILCVNSFQPHKNLPRVLAAFRRLREEFPAAELRLVGRPQENFATIPGLRALLEAPGVRVLGYLSDEDLATEYRCCSVLCYASLAEGFGLPVLEAAAAGALVLTSRTSALPEIAGDGALFVDPRRVESIVTGLREAITLPESLRGQLVARGRENLKRFSAAQAVRAYAALFDAVAGTVHEPVYPSGERMAPSAHA